MAAILDCYHGTTSCEGVTLRERGRYVRAGRCRFLVAPWLTAREWRKKGAGSQAERRRPIGERRQM